MSKVLTQKQEEFCRQYKIHKNAAKAARLAGYSPASAKGIGCKLLKTKEITDRLAELDNENGDDVTKAYVVEKLVDLLERCLEAKPVTKWDASKKENIETGVYTFDSRGAIKALEQLSKYLGMNNEKQDDKPSVVVNIIEDIK